jgi:predicted SAM-dependent methyltransferase
MNYQVYDCCPLCGSKQISFHADCTDYAVSKERFTLLRCMDCGFVFTKGAPLEEDLLRYEKLKQKLMLGDAPKGIFNKIYYRVRSLMLIRKANIVERYAYMNKGNLLNYGAKTGYFSNCMVRRGWRVTSIERYHEERLFSLEFFHHRMHDTNELPSLQPGSFDVVTMWHVFEHAHDPGELLRTFYKLLKPNGILLIAAPNISSTDAEYYGAEWAALDVPRHLWHFTPITINKLASNYGFTLMHHEGMPFDSFYISMLSEKNRNHKFPHLSGFMIGLNSWYVSLRHRERSSSLIYIFRKK